MAKTKKKKVKKGSAAVDPYKQQYLLEINNQKGFNSLTLFKLIDPIDTSGMGSEIGASIPEGFDQQEPIPGSDKTLTISVHEDPPV